MSTKSTTSEHKAGQVDRQALIARKQAVRGQCEAAHRDLERTRTLPSTWRTRRRIDELEKKIEQLMAEEYTLRLAIDRSG